MLARSGLVPCQAFIVENCSHSPLVKLPTPRTKVKSETIRGGEIGSSSAFIAEPNPYFRTSVNLLEMTPIICVQIAEKLGPNSPNINANKIKTPSLVPNPQRKAHERPLPTHEMTMTVRTGMRSERYPRRVLPGTEAAFRIAMRPVPEGCRRLSEEAYAEGFVSERWQRRGKGVLGSHKLGMKLPRLIKKIVIVPMIKGVLFINDQLIGFLFSTVSCRETGIRGRTKTTAMEPMTRYPRPNEIIVAL